jgi:predicted DNA-binding transcriptional regulator YafY
MGKLSNILTMMELLNTGRKYSVEELSSILEVSKRMIRLYKEELDKTGIYVDTIRGPYGGYVLNKSIRMPSRKFNRKDVLLLESITDKINDINIKEQLVLLTDKVQGIYQGSRKEANELNLKDENLSIYNIMTRAIKERKKVKILYYSYNKGDNERIIHPAGLFLYDNGWFIAAFCEYKNDMRHFEFRRIKKYELLDELF